MTDYSSMTDEEFRRTVQERFGYDPLAVPKQEIDYSHDEAAEARKLLERLDAKQPVSKKDILKILTPVYRHHVDFRTLSEPVEIPRELLLVIGWKLSGKKNFAAVNRRKTERGRHEHDFWREWAAELREKKPKIKKIEAARIIARKLNTAASDDEIEKRAHTIRRQLW